MMKLHAKTIPNPLSATMPEPSSVQCTPVSKRSINRANKHASMRKRFSDSNLFAQAREVLIKQADGVAQIANNGSTQDTQRDVDLRKSLKQMHNAGNDVLSVFAKELDSVRYSEKDLKELVGWKCIYVKKWKWFVTMTIERRIRNAFKQNFASKRLVKFRGQSCRREVYCMPGKRAEVFGTILQEYEIRNSFHEKKKQYIFCGTENDTGLMILKKDDYSTIKAQAIHKRRQSVTNEVVGLN